MKKYIKTALGCDVKEENYELPVKMPQYLLNDYSYKKYVIENQECLFVEPIEFSFVTYKKQYQKIKQITHIQVVLCLKNITPYQRKSLIEEHIPFIVENSQIYLPFLAMCLTEKYNEITEIEKFTPITQLVFLYLVYNKVKLSATELAQKLNCTVMSVTRAYKALVDCKLFHSENDGVKKYVVSNSDRGELLKNAEPFLINPIEKIVYIKKDVELNEYLEAGLYALSKKTMLNVTESDLCYAVYQKHKFNITNVIPKALSFVENAVKIEKWSYNPSILADHNTVDDISLILTLNDDKDERIQIELEKLRSKYEW